MVLYPWGPSGQMTMQTSELSPVLLHFFYVLQRTKKKQIITRPRPTFVFSRHASECTWITLWRWLWRWWRCRWQARRSVSRATRSQTAPPSPPAWKGFVSWLFSSKNKKTEQNQERNHPTFTSKTFISKIWRARCPKTHPGPKNTPKRIEEGRNWYQCFSFGPTN